MRSKKLADNRPEVYLSPPPSPSKDDVPCIGPRHIQISGDVTLAAYSPNPSAETKQLLAERERGGYNKRCTNPKIIANLNKTFEEIMEYHRQYVVRQNSASSSAVIDNFQPQLPNGTQVAWYRFIITLEGQLVCSINDSRFEEYSHQSMCQRAHKAIKPNMDLQNQTHLLAAGELGFDDQANLVCVSNGSGHYRIPHGTINSILLPCLQREGFTQEQINHLNAQRYGAESNQFLPITNYDADHHIPIRNYLAGTHQRVNELIKALPPKQAEKKPGLAIIVPPPVFRNPFSNDINGDSKIVVSDPFSTSPGKRHREEEESLPSLHAPPPKRPGISLFGDPVLSNPGQLSSNSGNHENNDNNTDRSGYHSPKLR